MKKIFTLLVVFIGMFGIANGQSYYYLGGTGSSAPYFARLADQYDIILSTDRTNVSDEINDVLSTEQTIPFSFDYYGSSFTKYKLSDNGYITFDLTATTSNPTNTNVPDAAAPKNAIMAFWDDLEFEQNQGFLFAAVSSTVGTSPNRTHVIKWFQANHTGRATEIDELLYFGIALHEQGGFDIVHEGQLTLNTAYTETATIGCTNGDGTEALMVEGPSASFPVGDYADMSDDKVYSFLPGPQAAKDIGITMVEMAEDAVLTAGSVPMETTIRNYGSETITKLDLNYTIEGGTAVTDNYTTNIAPGASKSFIHTTAWSPSAEGTYNVEIYASNPNEGTDENLENDNKFTGKVNVYASSFDRTPLYEIFTSSTCGPCTPGNSNFHSIISGKEAECTYIKYQQNFPGSGDPYASSQAVNRRSFYGINSIPRMEIDGGWDGNASGFTGNLHTEAKNDFSLVQINATFDKWIQEVSTTVEVTGLKDFSNVSIYAAVFETINRNNIKSNGESEFINVFKRFMSGQTGEGVSLSKGTPTTKTYNAVFQGDYKLAANGQNTNWININSNHDVEDFNNLKVLVWVQDNATKEVLQSAYATEVSLGVKDITKKINAAVVPN
ncbi:hypothetical protein N9595_03630, partial [Bacteroidia bacterium]|nr:hypothetical protein [Bacteroidia bacterium]